MTLELLFDGLAMMSVCAAAGSISIAAFASRCQKVRSLVPRRVFTDQYSGPECRTGYDRRVRNLELQSKIKTIIAVDSNN